MFHHHDKSKDVATDKALARDEKHLADKKMDEKHLTDKQVQDKKLTEKQLHDKEKAEKKLHEKELHDAKANQPHVSLLNQPTRLEMKAAAAAGTAGIPIGQAAGHWENNVLNPQMYDASYESNQENLARNGLRQGKPIVGQIDASQRAAIQPEIQQGDISLGLKGQELAGQRNVVQTAAAPAAPVAASTTNIKPHNESLGHVPVTDMGLHSKPIVQQPVSTTHTAQTSHLQKSDLNTVSTATLPIHDLKITPAVSHQTVSTSHETVDVAHQGGLLHNQQHQHQHLHTEKIQERPITSGTSHVSHSTATHTERPIMSTHTDRNIVSDRTHTTDASSTMARDAAAMRPSNPLTDGGSMGLGSALGANKGEVHHLGLQNNPADAIKSVPEGAFSKERDLALNVNRTNETLNREQYATGHRL